MITRREFVSGATVVLFLAPVSCGTSNGGPSGCSGVGATSSVALGHTHTVCVQESDLTYPPSGGATYTTSGPDPTHTVTLSSAQLSMLNGGQTVTVTTSTNGGHSHQFVLMKG